MVQYKCLNKKNFLFQNYSLVPLRKQDIQIIRNWRNKQISILRQKKKLTKKDQVDYYEKVIKKTFNKKNPNLMLFSFLLENICIGYGGLTNIDWIAKKSEVSFLLDTIRAKDKNTYQKDFRIFLNLILELAFNELKLNKLFTETYDIRPRHVNVLENVGFSLEGRLKHQVLVKGKYVDSLHHGYLRKDYAKK